jgi:uncharacterized protein (DUF1778 family)
MPLTLDKAITFRMTEPFYKALRKAAYLKDESKNSFVLRATESAMDKLKDTEIEKLLAEHEYYIEDAKND